MWRTIPGVGVEQCIKISVRSIVETVWRQGDLDSGSVGGGRRAVAGIRTHQKIQRLRGDNYKPEVSVSREIEWSGGTVTISGRIDGVEKIGNSTVLEEIKTTAGDLDRYSEREGYLHLAQLKIYAFIYAIDNGVDEVNLRLTYVHQETLQQRNREELWTFSDLEDFFNETVERFVAGLESLGAWIGKRNQAIELFDFPFSSMRPGQRNMMKVVYRTVRDDGTAMIEAPTGIGKTMAALFPAIKAMKRETILFFLTARRTGIRAAESALEIMRSSGLALRSLTITAKERCCPDPAVSCDPAECPYARGYYDRIEDAIAAGIEKESLTREVIDSVAREFTVCPFELSLDLSLLCDVVVCDYNYAFDPSVKLKRFFSEEPSSMRKGYTLLADESHNLPSRAREMYSASLLLSNFAQFSGNSRGMPSLMKVAGWFDAKRFFMGMGDGETVEEIPPEDLVFLLRELASEMESLLQDGDERAEKLSELYPEVSFFIKISELWNDGYRLIMRSEGDDMEVRLYCLDPSSHIASILKITASSLFSRLH